MKTEIEEKTVIGNGKKYVEDIMNDKISITHNNVNSWNVKTINTQSSEFLKVIQINLPGCGMATRSLGRYMGAARIHIGLIQDFH